MEIRTLAIFDADFPDDGRFAKSRDIERPHGHNVALALVDAFERNGFTVSEPEQHSFYGWAFFVSNRKASIRFLLQFPGPWLLLSEDRTPFLRRLMGGTASVHRQTLEILNQSLAHDRRFRDMQWFTRIGYEKRNPASPGHRDP